MSAPYKLLPCPFCGESAEIYCPWPSADVKEYYILHEPEEWSDCPAETRAPISYSRRHRKPEHAAWAWNARLGT